jgi:hypothetical protein
VSFHSKDQSKSKSNFQWMIVVNSLRENDLVLISQNKIEDVKVLFQREGKTFKEFSKSFNPDFGRVLCIVGKKAKKADSRVQLKAIGEESYKISSLCSMMGNKEKDFY